MITRRDLQDLEVALDQLEELHESCNVNGGLPVRRCLCAAASAWRRASEITDYYRAKLGMHGRLGL